eukprot:PhM_4_TR10195/c0_g1_i1/m.79761
MLAAGRRAVCTGRRERGYRHGRNAVVVGRHHNRPPEEVHVADVRRRCIPALGHDVQHAGHRTRLYDEDSVVLTCLEHRCVHAHIVSGAHASAFGGVDVDVARLVERRHRVRLYQRRCVRRDAEDQRRQRRGVAQRCEAEVRAGGGLGRRCRGHRVRRGLVAARRVVPLRDGGGEPRQREVERKRCAHPHGPVFVIVALVARVWVHQQRQGLPVLHEPRHDFGVAVCRQVDGPLGDGERPRRLQVGVEDAQRALLEQVCARELCRDAKLGGELIAQTHGVVVAGARVAVPRHCEEHVHVVGAEDGEFACLEERAVDAALGMCLDRRHDAQTNEKRKNVVSC